MTSTPKKVQFKNENTKIGSTPLTANKRQTSNISLALNKSESNINRDNLITVGVRIRPLNSKELSLGQSNSIRLHENKIIAKDKQGIEHDFICDYTFDSQASTQQTVYKCIGEPLLKHAIDGYNVSIFAYGQTGSGKTYSMIGTQDNEGLIPRFINNLYETKRKNFEDKGIQTNVEISYYEIYNEKIYDLLQSEKPKGSKNETKKNLTIRENPITGPFIVDLLTISAETADDAKLWFNFGNKRRATSCTNMNDKSSRSHSVFQISLTQIINSGENETIKKLVSSKINLIDLAGSERLNITFNSNLLKNTNGVRDSSVTLRETCFFKESTCINKSLLTLGKIICILSDRATNHSNISSANGYLPYRESSLTWLLKESIGGNAKTAMLATINASSSYIDETLSTLRYASKTACINNSAIMNYNINKKVFDQFGREIEINLLNSKDGLIGLDKELDSKLIKDIENEWKSKLDEANKRKEEEIKSLEKNLILLYENEKGSQNCCLINLNEDPSLSEKLIYLIKNSETIIGNNRDAVDIYLSGALIAPIHAKIIRNQNDGELILEHVDDKNYVTYINGEVVPKQKTIYHGDRIIFGGSHFFRLNNPKSKNLTQPQSQNEFKDYHFAKNEVENKQNMILKKQYESELNKFKVDGDLKIKEICDTYEKNIEKIKNDLEHEKLAKKQEIDQIRCESAKKIRKMIQHNIKLEAKLNIIEASTSNSLESSICSSISTTSSDLQTPNKRNLAEKLLSKIQNSTKHEYKHQDDEKELIEKHNSNRKFNLTLKINEANKICNILSLKYELKLYDIFDKESNSFIETVSVINKNLNLITCWNLDTFEIRLAHLRENYARFIDESELPNCDVIFCDTQDEWQDLELFNTTNTFTTKIIENALNKSNKACKRRLSLLKDVETTPFLTPVTKKLCSSSESRVMQVNDNYILGCCRDLLNEIIDNHEDSKDNFLSDTFYHICLKLMTLLDKIHSKHDTRSSIGNDSIDFINITLMTSNLMHNFESRPDWKLTEANFSDSKMILIQNFEDSIKNFIKTINIYFQSIENKLESMVYANYKSLVQQLNTLIEIKGKLAYYDSNMSCNPVIMNHSNTNISLFKHYTTGIDMSFRSQLDEFIDLEIRNNETENQKLFDLLINWFEKIKNFRENITRDWINDEESNIEVFSKNIEYATLVFSINKSLNESFINSQKIFSDMALKSRRFDSLLLHFNIILNAIISYEQLNCNAENKRLVDELILIFKNIKKFHTSVKQTA